MTASRSWRRAASSLTEKQILAISIIAALVIAASIALISGKTIGQVLGGYLIAQETMPPPPPPPTGGTTMPPPTGTYTPPTGGTTMPPPTGTFTPPPGGMMDPAVCRTGCEAMPNATPESKAACVNGCNNMGSYTGAPATGTTGTTGTTGGTPTSGTTTGSTSDPKAMCYSGCNSMPPDMQPNCRSGCDRMSAPTAGSAGGAGYDPAVCVSGCSTMTGSDADKQTCRDACNRAANGGTGIFPAGGTDPAMCRSRCTIGYMPGATPAMLDSCMKACDNMASSGGSGMYPSGPGSMSSCMTGAKGVRYANARYKENGVETSGPIYCAGFDTPPCAKGSASGGPQVEILSYAGPPTGCDTPASGSYGQWNTGGDPMEQRIMGCMSSGRGFSRPQCEEKCRTQSSDCPQTGGQWNTGGGTAPASGELCFFPAQWKQGTGTTGGSLSCKPDKTDCHEYTETGRPVPPGDIVGPIGNPSHCYKPSSGQWNTGVDTREQWIMSCMSSKSLSRPMCEAQCTPGSGCPQTGGSQWNSGGVQMPCTFDNGKIIYCTSPNVGCSLTPDGKQPLTDQQVGAIGPSCHFASGGGQWDSGGGNACGPDSSFGRETQGLPGSDPRYKEAEKRYGCGSYNTGGQWNTGGGQQGSMDCVIDVCRDNMMCMAPAYSVRCDSKECMTNSNCRPARSGGGGWNGGDEMVECCAPTPSCNTDICPAMMPFCQKRPRSECQRDGWQITGYGRGGGQQWNDLGGLKTQMLHPLQNYRRQAEEMALRARESGADISADGDAYIKAIDAAVSCITGATTQDALNGCGQFKAIEQLSMNIWNKIQAAGMSWQFKDIERRMQEMKKFADQIKKGGANVQQLEGILNDMAGAISAVKAAMIGGGSTPEMTRTDKIFALESEFWRAAEMLRGNFQDDRRYGDHEGDFGYADQCEMIRRKMEYAGNNYAAASQLQNMYGKCIEQAQGAMTGKGFDERQFSAIQDQFYAYGDQAYAEKACAMADSVMNEAGNAINKEAPMMIQMLGGNNANAAAKLNGLLAKAKDLLNRAYGHRQNNDCGKALAVMGDMEKMGQEADRIMSQAGISFGGPNDIEFVDYSDHRDDLSQKIAKAAGTSVKQLKKQLEDEGFGGAELAILDSMDPRLAARLFEKGAAGQGADMVKAAANADISATKLEAIIEENSQLLRKVADLELQVQNLKAGVKTIVEHIKNETFNPKIAPKIAALLETASTMTEKDFRAKYEEYKTQSNKENVKAGIDPFEDVHTFDKSHEWFVAAVKDGVESGLFKGKADGTFAPNDPVLRQDMAIVIARDQKVDDSGDAPESAFAQKASAYAKEALAGLERTGVDFSEFRGAPTEAATRLEVARMVASVYEDRLAGADESVLGKFADIDRLSEDDRAVVALIAANGIMTGTDGRFNPDGTFNRAQFATVMQRLDEAAGMAIVNGENDAGAATAKPADVSGAASHAAASESAASLSSVEEAKPEPVYHLSEISWNELKAIMSLVTSYESKHPLELGVSDVTKALVNVDTTFLSDYKIYGSDVVSKKRIALSNQLLDKPLAKLKEILLKAGQPGE